MRKSFLAVAISYALMRGVPLRAGPISPYTSMLNRDLYYRMLGQDKARAFDKTLTYGYRYAQ